ncbi:MAG: hypothetical protein PWQ91_1238 [Eubacteriales bacterium]|nr:hypothetical protein [Eubacteriales bacterium]
MSHPPFVEILKEKDPLLYEAVEKVREAAFAGNALDLKTKFLICMALDAAHGAGPGVKTLSQLARQHGATEEEIKETLRLVYYIAGNNALAANQFGYERG